MDHNNATQPMSIAEIVRYLNSFPPGYKFDPTDDELIVEYLLPKINGGPLPINLMHEVNIYKHNPDYLAGEYSCQGNKGWYFFTSRDKKYRNGQRPNRKAGDGFWKATGADKVIQKNGINVGYRKALVFYKGRPPKGEKTLWIMHEFRVAGPSQVKKRKTSSTDDDEDTSMRLDDFILCRIYKKCEGSPRKTSRTEQDIEDEGNEVETEAALEGETFSMEDKFSPPIDDNNVSVNNLTNNVVDNVNNMYNTTNNNGGDNVNMYTTSNNNDVHNIDTYNSSNQNNSGHNVDIHNTSNNNGGHNVNMYYTSNNDGHNVNIMYNTSNNNGVDNVNTMYTTTNNGHGDNVNMHYTSNYNVNMYSSTYNNSGLDNVNMYTTSYNNYPYVPSGSSTGIFSTGQMAANTSFSGMDNGGASTSYGGLLYQGNNNYPIYGDYHFSEDVNNDYDHDEVPIYHFFFDPPNPTVGDPVDMMSHEDVHMSDPFHDTTIPIVDVKPTPPSAPPPCSPPPPPPPPKC